MYSPEPGSSSVWTATESGTSETYNLSMGSFSGTPLCGFVLYAKHIASSDHFMLASQRVDKHRSTPILPYQPASHSSDSPMKPQSAFHFICAKSALGVMAFNRIICGGILSMLTVLSSNYCVTTFSFNGHAWIWIVSAILLTVYVIYSCIYFCEYSRVGVDILVEVFCAHVQ